MLFRLTSPLTGGSYGSSIPVKPVCQMEMLEVTSFTWGVPERKLECLEKVQRLTVPLIFPVRASLYRPLGSRASQIFRGKSKNTYRACTQLDRLLTLTELKRIISEHTSIKLESGSRARHASRSLLYGDIKLAMHMIPASAKSFATSPAQKIQLQ